MGFEVDLPSEPVVEVLRDCQAGGIPTRSPAFSAARESIRGHPRRRRGGIAEAIVTGIRPAIEGTRSSDRASR